PRSQSYDVTTPSSRASVSPPTPVGGAGSDVESTDAEWSVTSHSGVRARLACRPAVSRCSVSPYMCVLCVPCGPR
ncbi:MAG: hypothetical protein P4L40_04310, partial [Terracidiphilus sp.]|nr:hypothetical protein [Terracidiphilus sp.]